MPKDDVQFCAAHAIVTLTPDSVSDAATKLPVPCWAKCDYIPVPMVLKN